MPDELLPLNGHNVLIQKMRQQGYRADRKGVCLGVSHMAAQAILLDELDIFCRSICTLLFTRHIKHGKQLVNDILPLLDGIQLYQEYNCRLKHLLDSSGLNPLEYVATLVSPVEIENLGGISHAYDHIGIYKPHELILHLTSLRHLVQDAENHVPFAFIIKTYEHAVCINYCNLTCTWQFIDANALPMLEFSTEEELASQLIHSFSFADTLSQPTITMTTEILTIGCYDKSAHDYIRSWRNSPDFQHANRVDSVKAQMADSQNNISLLLFSSQYNNERLAHYLLTLGANPNIQQKTSDKYDGATPLMFAAINGNDSLAKLLLRFGADPQIQRTQDHATAACIARHRGFKSIVDLLHGKKNKTPLRHPYLKARMFAARQIRHQTSNLTGEFKP